MEKKYIYQALDVPFIKSKLKYAMDLNVIARPVKLLECKKIKVFLGLDKAFRD